MLNMRKITILVLFLALVVLTGCRTAEENTTVAFASAPVATIQPTHTPALTPFATQEPTPEPTQEPTPTPSPTPSLAPTPEPITNERLDSGEFDSYFDDAVLIGDSLTGTLSRYAVRKRADNPDFLGGARFMGVISMTVQNASTNRPYDANICFQYRGKPCSITDGINGYGAKKAFIMLGTNDIDSHPMDSVEPHYVKLIEVLREKCPDTKIIFQCILPITEPYSKKLRIPIEKWNAFNETLARICQENDVDFLYFADELMDEHGYLPLSLSWDREYHPNERGEDIWIRALRLYAARQMYPDAEYVDSLRDFETD